MTDVVGRAGRGGRMNISLDLPEGSELKPRISVIGIGGAGCNAINNMIATGLEGVEFIAANTDAQALAASSAEHRIQLGAELTEGLGAGARPEIGREAAEEAIEEIRAQIDGCHMVFLAAGMGGGTGTGAVSVIARIAREMNILTVAIVSKPFQFEGSRRMRTAEAGITELRNWVDTLIVIPNQNLFRLANEKTTFAEAFVLADQVLYSGIACIVDLIVKDGLINLDFADVKVIMKGMGSAMMGTGEASGENRATRAAEDAISNPLLDNISLRGAKGLLISIIGGRNLTLFEVDEAASRVKQEADPDANIIVGASFEEGMDERIRVSIVAAGLEGAQVSLPGMYGARDTPAPSVSPTLPMPMPSTIFGTTVSTGSGNAPTDYPDSPLDDDVGIDETAAIPSDANNAGAVDDMARASSGGETDPYRGDTPMDEFARALSEVMGTVDDNGTAIAGAASPGAWRSPDGVIIEDGFEPSSVNAPPPLPDAEPTQPTADTSTGFVPAPPADLPRRVPDISEFPEIVQREYQAKAAAEHGAGRSMGGMPNILRRLAGLGRQSSQLASTDKGESDANSSMHEQPHSGAELEEDGQSTTRNRRRV